MKISSISDLSLLKKARKVVRQKQVINDQNKAEKSLYLQTHTSTKTLVPKIPDSIPDLVPDLKSKR